MERYLNEANACDGDIYAKIRAYQSQNQFDEKRWWSRLSVNKQNDLKQLFKKSNEVYVLELDKLLPFPALLAGLRISMVHHFMAMKCEEVS